MMANRIRCFEEEQDVRRRVFWMMAGGCSLHARLYVQNPLYDCGLVSGFSAVTGARERQHRRRKIMFSVRQAPEAGPHE